MRRWLVEKNGSRFDETRFERVRRWKPRLLPDRVEVRLCRNVDGAIGDHGAAVNRSGEFDQSERLKFLGRFEDVKFAVFGAKPDLAISDESGSPNAGLSFVRPVFLAGLAIEAVDVAFVFRGVL